MTLFIDLRNVFTFRTRSVPVIRRCKCCVSQPYLGQFKAITLLNLLVWRKRNTILSQYWALLYTFRHPVLFWSSSFNQEQTTELATALARLYGAEATFSGRYKADWSYNFIVTVAGLTWYQKPWKITPIGLFSTTCHLSHSSMQVQLFRSKWKFTDEDWCSVVPLGLSIANEDDLRQCLRLLTV